MTHTCFLYLPWTSQPEDHQRCSCLILGQTVNSNIFSVKWYYDISNWKETQDRGLPVTHTASPLLLQKGK